MASFGSETMFPNFTSGMFNLWGLSTGGISTTHAAGKGLVTPIYISHEWPFGTGPTTLLRGLINHGYILFLSVLFRGQQKKASHPMPVIPPVTKSPTTLEESQIIDYTYKYTNICCSFVAVNWSILCYLPPVLSKTSIDAKYFRR